MKTKNKKTDDTLKESSGGHLSENLMNKLFGHFEVGDSVYYKTPEPNYAVKKSIVVEVIEKTNRRFLLSTFVYVLANGTRLRHFDAFATREIAEAAIIEDLKSRLASQKVALENLLHEMAYEEDALKRLERNKSVK